ncbi:MAG: zeta toxin family protein [Patescibacteria group bacterium]|nr:zeta toxin family protein [Patescibacteria group bacterium]
MFFLLINGASCSGKSSVIKEIMKTQDELFHLPYDSLKWLFSKYNSKTHYQKVQEFVFSVAIFAMKKKYNIISDSSLYKKDRNKLIDLAKKHDYKIIEVNLKADFSVLEKRFEERVTGALADPSKRITNTSKERFKELVETFEKEKNQDAIKIRTDDKKIEEVVQEILKLIYYK